MKLIRAYQCEHCKKIAKTVKTIQNHEIKCFSNPINKACGSCEKQSICFTKGITNCKDYLELYCEDDEAML